MSIAGLGTGHVLILEFQDNIEEIKVTDQEETAQRWYDQWVQKHEIITDEDDPACMEQDFWVFWRQADSADLTSAYLF